MASLRAAPASPVTRRSILSLRRFTHTLVSVRVTRDSSYRFTPGHFARVGLAGTAGAVVTRPLSIASAPSAPHLEFICTLVPGGEFTAALDSSRTGDPVEIATASFGFLTADALAPGTDLWLLATGTGLAPFLSMLRDPGVWTRFARIAVVHSVRQAAELCYAGTLREFARHPPHPDARARLHYAPVVTREPGATALSARIPELLADGRLAHAIGCTPDVARSRFMVCGNPAMGRDLRQWLTDRGYRSRRRGVPGQMAFENYW
ncbi:MAG: ferredoxin--NADP reductase [Betaproteobacteria bacterium]